MRNAFEYYEEENYLAHHGILGQKWGVRRFQNSDGTLTEAGKKRNARHLSKELNSMEQKQAMRAASYASLSRANELTKYKINKNKFKGKDVSELEQKSSLTSKRMKELESDYSKNKKKLDALLREIDADNDYVWRTSLWTYSNYDHSKGLKDLGRLFGPEGYYQMAEGTRYDVKLATDKRKDKARWNVAKKQYDNVPIRQETYYY